VEDAKGFPNAEQQRSPEEASQVIPALERDLEEFLVHNLDQVEPGLTLHWEEGREVGRQYEIEGGRIDLLCVDSGGDYVVIELKACEAGDSAVGQLLGYVGYVRRRMCWGRKARGVLVAPAFSERAKYAAALAGLALRRYRIKYSLEVVET